MYKDGFEPAFSSGSMKDIKIYGKPPQGCGKKKRRETVKFNGQKNGQVLPEHTAVTGIMR